ncbi:FAD-binding and (Fe-S)-binding domain-containing protein [Bacteroides sp.]|uniref:FAD-binding and (Fe-S)-binding domain-containing protein n=1 Tax=Bacteroides sp. TaxID=29523 RepID=UPI00260F8B66|nr:FAD-binding and (Fe-S)-binding domain-containing protein [Bacteroides sp.]MDD3038773.1 FAD-linked oxidase C-terminal domain-containing protein [Bacteroides sp.]
MVDMKIDGDLYFDSVHKIMYATDASAYKEMPIGVAYPKNSEDIKRLVSLARAKGVSIIPRTAGTSLAGQVVGDGLVVDTSRYLNHIIDINKEERWVRVEPGVVLDELNLYCKPYDLFFAPETSTSNRCCVGGMVGNNSCGSHSLVYGNTRKHLLEATVILSDGSKALLKSLTRDEVEAKCQLTTLEGDIYRKIISILSDEQNQKEIIENYPDRTLTRRNTGYALDELLYTSYFDDEIKEDFNLCKLLAGSEGTLAIITELKLNLEPLPPAYKAVVAMHCNSFEESFRANLVALKHLPVAVELIDGKILELSKQNISQSKNRQFINGDPVAVLVVEFLDNNELELKQKCNKLIADLQSNGMGYHYPVIFGNDVSKVWALRKAGLGLLSGMVGDAKPVSVVEDTAVIPALLPEYMADFRTMMEGFGLSCVYHAHISTGELHLRPILNLKNPNDKALFRKVAKNCTLLVKKYRGSISGEHGDGRLRGEFIPLLVGEKVYSLMRDIKQVCDSQNIFNKGKIVDTPPMDENLRYEEATLKGKTYFDYTKQGGYIRAIEQCNGSGDCRKSELFAGVMCPTFRAIKEERYATRARANVLRESMLNSKDDDFFSNKDVIEILDGCISCKGCKSECPSNVDMTRYKAEFLQHYYDKHHIPLRINLVANIAKIHHIFSRIPQLYNTVAKNKCLSSLLKQSIGFTQRRSIPQLYKTTLRQWYKRNYRKLENPKGSLYLFADEFTNHMDVEIGIAFIKLLNGLGYQVEIPKHTESGRAALSKGLLKQAKKRAETNINLLKDIISEETPLVGIEPSSLLSFRDEYIDLVDSNLKETAILLSKHVLLYDEFIVGEIDKGNITISQFKGDTAKIKLHGHCHQKSLASIEPSRVMLSLPENYSVEVVPSGCCGMAGSFGYEKEHYDLSMQIGETTLFPEIRKSDDYLISAPGTSCRHQIKDGTGRDAYHPIELMYNVLKS